MSTFRDHIASKLKSLVEQFPTARLTLQHSDIADEYTILAEPKQLIEIDNGFAGACSALLIGLMTQFPAVSVHLVTIPELIDSAESATHYTGAWFGQRQRHPLVLSNDHLPVLARKERLLFEVNDHVLSRLRCLSKVQHRVDQAIESELRHGAFHITCASHIQMEISNAPMLIADEELECAIA